MKNSPKKVLFLSLSGIGNYLMQSPTIEVLKKAHPTWHITVWVAPRGTKVLAENDPNVDDVIEMPIKSSASEHLKTIQKLRQKKFDIGIVLSPGQLIKSAAYLYLSSIPTRIGNTYPLNGNQYSRFLLTDAVPENRQLHDIEQNLQLLRPLDVSVPSKTNYTLTIPDINKAEAIKLLTDLNIPTDKKLVGMHAGSAPDLMFKRWPLKNFATIGKELIKKHNAHILLFGGPNEEEQKQELQHIIGSNTTIISSSLLTTAAIMQHCDLIVSNDSGLMHLATASGVKTYGLFGPTDEAKTGPRGADSHVIRAPGTEPVYDIADIPHLGKKPHKTILAITPKIVINQLR